MALDACGLSSVSLAPRRVRGPPSLERGEEVVPTGATSVRFRDGSPPGGAALSGGREANGDRPSGTGTHGAAGGSRRGFARVHLLVLELCRAV